MTDFQRAWAKRYAKTTMMKMCLPFCLISRKVAKRRLDTWGHHSHATYRQEGGTPSARSSRSKTLPNAHTNWVFFGRISRALEGASTTCGYVIVVVTKPQCQNVGFRDVAERINTWSTGSFSIEILSWRYGVTVDAQCKWLRWHTVAARLTQRGWNRTDVCWG